MNSTKTFVKDIKQKDNHTFTVVWNDGRINDYRLSELQKNCSCAKCRDEATGLQLVDANTIDKNVRAKSIVNVGRYAIRIQFTNGCSTGIYDFDSLRRMTKP